MAAERLAAQQDILAPIRAAEDAKLYRTLQAKGLAGLGSHEGSVSGAQNPIAAALYGARAQADKKAAYESLREGEDYLDSLLRRSRGLFSSAEGVEGTGRRALDVGGQFTDKFTRNEAEKTRAVTDLLKEAYAAQRKGAYDQSAMDRILEAEKSAGSAKAMRTGEAIKGGTDILGTILKGTGGLSGLFGNIGSWFSSPASGYMSDLDLGGFDSMALGDWGTGADFGNFDYADYL
jgi:hypothetical protein